MTKVVLMTALWYVAGACVAIGFGATDFGVISLAGALWVWLFS